MGKRNMKVGKHPAYYQVLQVLVGIIVIAVPALRSYLICQQAVTVITLL